MTDTLTRSRLEELLDRVLSKTDMSGDCWIWTGYKARDGYGRIAYREEGKPRGFSVHRWVYAQIVEEIPSVLTCDHLCENRLCINPDHIEIVTRGENTRRGAKNNRYTQAMAARTHCNQGHEFTPENTGYRAKGSRLCRTCTNRATRIAKAKARLL